MTPCLAFFFDSAGENFWSCVGNSQFSGFWCNSSDTHCQSNFWSCGGRLRNNSETRTQLRLASLANHSLTAFFIQSNHPSKNVNPSKYQALPTNDHNLSNMIFPEHSFPSSLASPTYSSNKCVVSRSNTTGCKKKFKSDTMTRWPCNHWDDAHKSFTRSLSLKIDKKEKEKNLQTYELTCSTFPLERFRVLLFLSDYYEHTWGMATRNSSSERWINPRSVLSTLFFDSARTRAINLLQIQNSQPSS